jgi:ParB family chromosome partitioning protein
MSKKALGKGLSSIFKEMGSPVLDDESGDFVHEIEIADISPNPFQPRREFNEKELKELSDSISQNGLLQPILLRRNKNKYQLVTGERRLRAVQLIPRKTIQAYVRKNVSDHDMMELSLIENIQRVQLSPIEEARAYLQLVKNFGYSHEDLASRLNKSRSAVSNTLRLLKLDNRVQSYLEQGKLTAGHARAILQKPRSKQLKFAQKIVSEDLNVRKTEKMGSGQKAHDPNLDAFVDKIKYSLGAKVNVKGTAKKGRLEISYNSQEELEKIGEILMAGSKGFK